MSVRVALPYAAAVALSLMLDPTAIRAQDSKPSAGAAEIELTPDEKAERDARKGCKVAICSAFHVRKPDGGDIACNVAKSWRKEQLQTLVSKAKVSWPWGKVRCVADIRLKREILIKAMTEPKYEAALDRHAVTCDVERDAAEKTEIKFDFVPKVTFENGKAVKASLNWGKIEAPSVVKGAMWTATATDNTFNVLQSSVVEDINAFIGEHCLEVKDEWQPK